MFEKNINYRKLTIHTIIIVAIILLAAISLQSGFAATVNVNNSTDGGGIIEGLNNANDNDTILLEEGNYTGTNNTGLTINKNITIQGNGPRENVIIDAQGLSKIFKINNNLNVTFINITFTNANSSDWDGAAITGSGIDITIENCVFINNTATNIAAAISLSGQSSFNLVNSTFINNYANGAGAIIVDYFSNGIIEGCNFINNFASVSGGSIVIQRNSTITISICVFNNSYTNGFGGAIRSYDYSKLFVINSTFNNCTSVWNGGAIFVDIGEATIIGSTFTNNSAGRNGDAIFVTGNATISDNNMADNKGNNSVIFVNSNSNLNISNNNITNNNGSGIYNTGSSVIENNTINDNRGHGIYSEGGTVEITNNEIIGNGGNGVSNNGTVIMERNVISNNEDQKSILAISSSVSGRVVTVTVKATDINGNVLVGATVNFYVDGVLMGTEITDNDGVVQFIYTATKAGTNDILAVMDEFSVIDVDDNEFIYSTVSNTTSVDVAKFNTNVTIVVSNATAGKQTIVRGVLVDENGNPISGASLNVVIGGKSYSVVTGADGTWELPYTPSKAGNYNAKVYYNGDTNYLASTGSVGYTVAQEQEDTPTKVDIRLVKRNNSKAVRHGNVVYMKWLTFKNFGASGSQTINAKIIIKNLKYKLWKVYNKKLNYKFAKNNIKFKINLKSNGVFKLKLKVYRPIKQK